MRIATTIKFLLATFVFIVGIGVLSSTPFAYAAIDLSNVNIQTSYNNSIPKTVTNLKKLTLPNSVNDVPTPSMDSFCQNYTYYFESTPLHITTFDFEIMQDQQGSDIGYNIICHYQNTANLPQIEPSDTTKDYWNFNTQLILFVGGLLFFTFFAFGIILSLKRK